MKKLSLYIRRYPKAAAAVGVVVLVVLVYGVRLLRQRHYL